MARRIHVKLMIRALQWLFWIFWISLYGFIIFVTVNSSQEFDQEQSESVFEKLPSLENINSDKHSLQKLQTNVNIDGLQSQNNVNVKTAMSLTKLCPEISLPSRLAVEEAWQPVDGPRSMFTFSAYYIEDRQMVYVIGVRPQNKVSVICQLWQRIKGGTLELMGETEANVRALLDDKGHRYAPTVFECFANSSSSPVYVSLVTKKCDTPSNVLKIRSATKELPYKRPLTVCAPPLRSNYDNTKEFVKWIEFNRLLGVEKFVLYNYSSGINMARILDHYSGQGLTDVVQWRPPMVVEGLTLEMYPIEIEKYGETVALNDCLFRNKKYSEFIANLGINEFIIPHTENEASLTDMVNTLGNKGPAYHISMSYLKKNKTRPAQTEGAEGPSPPLDKNQELMNFERVLPVSKLIIRTADVDFTLMNTVPDMETVTVSYDKLLMHRYPGGGQYQKLGVHIDEALPESLVNKAKTNVQDIWKKVPNAIRS